MPSDKAAVAKPGIQKKPASGIARPSPRATRIVAPARARSESSTNKSGASTFTQIVSAEPLAGFAAVSVIREGYPARILKAASDFFGVSDARIQTIVRVPATTAHRLEKNQSKIDPAATERVYRMGTVTRMAIEVFEDRDSAVAWMRQPNRALGDVAPLDLMDTEPGAVSVRQVLNALATGGVA